MCYTDEGAVAWRPRPRRRDDAEVPVKVDECDSLDLEVAITWQHGCTDRSHSHGKIAYSKHGHATLRHPPYFVTNIVVSYSSNVSMPPGILKSFPSKLQSSPRILLILTSYRSGGAVWTIHRTSPHVADARSILILCSLDCVIYYTLTNHDSTINNSAHLWSKFELVNACTQEASTLQATRQPPLTRLQSVRNFNFIIKEGLIDFPNESLVNL